MRSASSGLRHPASASCLAGRCPNNSSLFPPLAAVVVVAGHIQRKDYFIFRNTGASADAPVFHFHRWGRNGKRQLQRRFLRKRGAAGITPSSENRGAERPQTFRSPNLNRISAIDVHSERGAHLNGFTQTAPRRSGCRPLPHRQRPVWSCPLRLWS